MDDTVRHEYAMLRRIPFLVGWCLMAALVALTAYLARHDAARRMDAAFDVDAPRRPSEWGWIQRTYPYYRADVGAYHQALAQASALRAAAKTGRFGTWEPVGPTNVGGRVVDVVFDPSDPSVIYAAAATGGVFKSTDGGATWAPIFDDQAVLTIGDIAIDPSDPQTLYVGTGEANGGHNNFAGGGIYKTTDGGRTWAFLGLAATTSIGRIRIDPLNPARVFVAAVGSYFAPNPERGVYRSDDGGASWQRVLFVSDSTGVIDLVMRPDDPDVLLAAAWERVRRPQSTNLYGNTSGIYRTVDGGDSWERLGPANGLPDPASLEDATGRATIGRIGLALCRDAPDTMYALYTDGFGYLDLLRTDDGGDTWRTVDPQGRLARGFVNFSWYFGQVRVHPHDPDRVYVLDVQLMRSADGGSTWSFEPGTHVDHHALAFDPGDADALLEGNDGGLARSDDGGASWTPVQGLPVTQFYEINYDPSFPNRLYGGTQDNGTIRVADGEPTAWQVLNIDGDGFYVNVDPIDPLIVYAESQFGYVQKSLDGGQHFAPATNGLPDAATERRGFSTPVVMDPNDSDVLYFGALHVYRTENGAQQWQQVSPPLGRYPEGPMLGTITSIAVAPTNSDVIYVGTDDGKVWVSDDYAATWRDVTHGLPNRWVTRVVVDPANANTAYATFSGLKWRDPQPHVFRTRDRGLTWENLSTGLPDAPVNAFAVDPASSDYLYAGTDVGAFASVDGGRSWEPLGTGLPAVSVYDMKIIPDERVLLAGTHGRSMFRLPLPQMPTHVEPATPALTVALNAAFPNPFVTQTTLHARVEGAAHARMEIFDVRGRRVRLLVDRGVSAPVLIDTWDGTDDGGRRVASGTYFVRLTASGPDGGVTRTVSVTHIR